MFEHPQKNARSGAMRNHQSWATGLCLAVLMATCDSETGPAGSPTDLSLSEANDIGAAFEDDTVVFRSYSRAPWA
jgi:hypothetical protein